MKKSSKRPIGIIAALFAVFSAVALSPVIAGAAFDTKSTTINANVAAVISMTTTSTVNINITPTASGAMSSASDTVTVSTNNATGYNLKLSNGDTTLTLINGANTIAAHAGTFASPTTLAVNTWGYRVDGSGSFGSGPTSAESSVASSAYSWAGLPNPAGAHTLKTTGTNSTSDVTTVWFGASANTTKPNGTYTDTVTYTATTN